MIKVIFTAHKSKRKRVRVYGRCKKREDEPFSMRTTSNEPSSFCSSFYFTHAFCVRTKKEKKNEDEKDESQNECNSHWIFKLAIKHSDRTHTNKRRQFLYISFLNGVGILKMKLLLSQTMWRDTHVRNNVKWNEWCLINYYFVTESENDSLSKNTSLWLYPSYGIGL